MILWQNLLWLCVMMHPLNFFLFRLQRLIDTTYDPTHDMTTLLLILLLNGRGMPLRSIVLTNLQLTMDLE